MNQERDVIRHVPCPRCHLCGDVGKILYQRLKDRLLGAAGEWNLRQCSSPGCSLIWMDPMPSKEDLWKAYADYYTHPAERQDDRAGFLVRLHRAAREGYFSLHFGYTGPRFQRMLAPLIYAYPGAKLHADYAVAYQPARRPAGTFLEVGFGRGDILQRMGRLGWDAHGVDVDPKAVLAARERGLKASLGTLQSVAFPDDKFDAIALNHVIEHVYEPLDLMAECRRVLKRGGQLVLTTPNSNGLGHRRFAENWLHLDAPRHLHLFNLLTIQDMVRRSGLTVRTLTTSARGAASSYRASSCIQRNGRLMPSQRTGIGNRIRMMGFYLLESVLTDLSRPVGDEILLIAAKP